LELCATIQVQCLLTVLCSETRPKPENVSSNNLRAFLIIIATSISTIPSLGQAPKERDFVLTLEKVVAALAARDSGTLSKFIDKTTGVFIPNRIGVFDTYKHFSALGFSDSSYPNAPFYDNVKLTSLRYSKLPTFDCEKWTKIGTFVDTTHTDHLLSKIAKDINKESKDKVSAKKISDFHSLENKSRRVVIADNTNELIIYLGYINNKWVLTIIDKATCDCSV
jgi:hypothetical protein